MIHLHRKLAFLHSLWFGKKPEMSTFLKLFVVEFSELFTSGFCWLDRIGVRVEVRHTTQASPSAPVCDAPAFANVGMKHFSGFRFSGFRFRLLTCTTVFPQV